MIEEGTIEGSVDSSQQESLTTGEPQEQPSIYDLDSAEKFKWQGREWTTKELQSAYMAHSDYTRKTQALAEERKFYDNLSVDLEAVKSNPALIQEFKRVYPERFHSYLNYVQEKQPQLQAQTNQQSIDTKFVERVERLEKGIHEREVAAIEAELDAKFKQYSDKYPMADEEAVIARAQALINRGEKITDQTWDNLWKSVHERNQSLADKYYSEKVKQQKTASAKAKDVGSGGGTVGRAPHLPKTIKQATDDLLASGEL